MSKPSALQQALTLISGCSVHPSTHLITGQESIPPISLTHVEHSQKMVYDPAPEAVSDQVLGYPKSTTRQLCSQDLCTLSFLFLYVSTPFHHSCTSLSLPQFSPNKPIPNCFFFSLYLNLIF